MYQRTIAESVGCVGIGLHSGRKVSLKVRPAPVDNGIVFIRTDLPSSPVVKASVENVVDTTHATTIGVGDAKVSTIEHLMASFAGLGIDNAFVEVDAPEVPIMDGSAGPLLFLLKSGGIRVQHKSKRFIVIKKAVKIGNEQEGWAELSPAKEFKVSCSVDFDHPMLQKQVYKMSFSDTNFEKELSMARTFGFLNEVEYLRSQGLIKGGSLDNAIVVDDFRVLNEGGLRFSDEFVRHKMLDAIGDISILGMPVIGHLSLHKSGHRLNFELAQKLIADPKAWKIVEVKKKETEKVKFKVPHFGMMKPSVS